MRSLPDADMQSCGEEDRHEQRDVAPYVKAECQPARTLRGRSGGSVPRRYENLSPNRRALGVVGCKETTGAFNTIERRANSSLLVVRGRLEMTFDHSFSDGPCGIFYFPPCSAGRRRSPSILVGKRPETGFCRKGLSRSRQP